MKAFSWFAVVGICLVTAAPASAGDVAVLINEIDADQAGTDSAEFIELYDGGVGNTDLTGLVLVFMTGSTDASYRSFDLDGMSTNDQGYFVLCGDASNVPNCDLDVTPNTNLIQNGADAVALYTGDASDFPTGTPVTTANLLDAIVYDTNDNDDAGLLVLLNADQPQVNECGGAGCTTDSNQRCPNGSGGARNTDTYAQAIPSPGLGNNCAEVFGACCDDSTGECTDDVSEANCVGAGNRYGGDESDCSTIDPPCVPLPTGACCDDSTGVCTDDVTQGDCEGAGRRYGGDGVDCSTIDPPCVPPPTGACCSAGFCGDDVSQLGCETGGGTYQGDDSQCPQDCGTESTMIINEIRIAQPGVDDDEYFELAGDAGESLDGVTYLVIGDTGAGQPANSGVIEFIIDLSGHSINASGLFLVAEDTFDLPGAPAPDLITALNFEPGQGAENVTHVLVAGFTGELLQDLDLDDNGTLDIEPWAGVIDLIALISEENPPVGTEYHYGPPTVGPAGEFVPGHAYLCEPSGIWLIGAFDPADGTNETPGEANPDCECGDEGTGNCFDPEGTGTPFCEDGECCQDICDNHDATCCTEEWDDFCATLAAQHCLEGGKPPVVALSEIRISMDGTDTDEYFELTAEVDTILDGVSYIVIGDGPGGSGVIEHVTDFTSLDQFFSNFFVGAEETFSLCDFCVDLEGPLNFEDSDNVTHMLVWNFTGDDGDDLDTDNDGILDVEPWQVIIDSVAIIGNNEPCVDESGACIYSDNVVGPDTIFTPGHVYKCDPTQAWTVGEYDLEDPCAVDTPQAVNQNCELVCPCGSENAGSCFEVNDNANCDDAECCDLVINGPNGDETCADDWGQTCVDLALGQCLSCGHQSAGNCLEANGTPFCNFEPCCDTVCGLDPTCCELPDGWDQGCADLADANCDIPRVEQGDLVFALSDPDPALTLELLRGPAEENGGAVILDFWDEPFMQSVEFDNLDCISHNNRGNLLALNFGSEPPGGTGGTIHSLATCSPTSTDQFIGDTFGDGGEGLTPTRIGGLSVSPDNSKIAVTGYDSREVIVYDYTAGNCEGEGASLSGARETTGNLLCSQDTQGTAWLDNDTVLAFSGGGEIIAVDADSMASQVVATVDTIDFCGQSYTELEYNPQISPNVYAMYSDYSPVNLNLLFVLDPTDNFSLLDTFDYSTSMDETAREIAFDADGNLYVSQFGGGIDIILDAANLGSLADNNSLDWYATAKFSNFNALDVAIGQTGPPPACSPCSGDCCDSGGNGTPGCNDDECCNLVCDTAGFESCCDVEWTAACAAEAQEVCSDSVCCGVCPTDVDGSGSTGAFDLAFLLGNWGPTVPDSACLDADEDGIIGAFDLAFLLGNWGPC